MLLPKDAIMCKDANCMSEQHKEDLCTMYDDVVATLYDGSNPFYKHNKHGSTTLDLVGMSM